MGYIILPLQILQKQKRNWSIQTQNSKYILAAFITDFLKIRNQCYFRKRLYHQGIRSYELFITFFIFSILISKQKCKNKKTPNHFGVFLWWILKELLSFRKDLDIVLKNNHLDSYGKTNFILYYVSCIFGLTTPFLNIINVVTPTITSIKALPQ